MASPQDAIKLVKDSGTQIVDLRFCDLPGLMQHFSIPAHALDEELFADGAGFDGSSIRGFQEIQESDMILIPDPDSAYVDPFREHPTVNINCFVKDPVTGEMYTRDPRGVARKAEAYLKETGLADTSYWGPEPEFYILDSVRFDQKAQHGFYFLDSSEGIWNSGKDEEGGNKGHKPRHKEGYFPVPPMDSLQDMRTEMMLRMMDAGVNVEVQHHEVGTAGQAEIDMGFGTMVEQADRVMILKYFAKNVAHARGKTVTFMPKPIFEDNGTGMHVHQSLWSGDKNLFYDEKGYAGLSDMARYYIGGLLKHAPSLLALTNPTTNSYRRLVPGYEAPVNLVYSQRNRSACVRIPLYSKSEKAKRLEFRCPDPSANPYLAFAAMLMAGLDGITNKIDPGDAMDKNIYDLPPEEAAGVPTVPSSLEEALRALEDDHDYLLRGDVFTEDLVESWLSYKWESEVEAIKLRPHPWEFHLYYDI
jgi:glutamine synthetase